MTTTTTTTRSKSTEASMERQPEALPKHVKGAIPVANGTIGSDGKHELWREGIYDHDNAPKVKRRDGSYASVEKLRGFLNYERNPQPYRHPLDRVMDWGELNPVREDPLHYTDTELQVQTARCMDCGTPFCQTHDGC